MMDTVRYCPLCGWQHGEAAECLPAPERGLKHGQLPLQFLESDTVEAAIEALSRIEMRLRMRDAGGREAVGYRPLSFYSKALDDLINAKQRAKGAA
jgi:hypothetical protein